jgi:hypothetical protein
MPLVSSSSPIERFVKRLLKAGQRIAVYVVEEVHLYTYLLFFLIVVVAFAVAYQMLTSSAQGVGQSGKALVEISFSNAIYFSIVTIATLGYGDLYPVGYSKFLSCVEVLFGLTFFGVAIAKMTSRRLSYHVEKLFSSQSQKHLEDYTLHFDRLGAELKQLTKEFATVLQTTPSQNAGQPVNLAPAISKFSGVLIDFSGRSKTLSRYLVAEVDAGNYFGIVAPDVVCRLGESVDQWIYHLGLLIASLPPDGRMEIFDISSRRRITESLEIYQQMCDMIKKQANNPDVGTCFMRLRTTCDGLPSLFFSLVAENETADQPDQDLPSAGQAVKADPHNTQTNTTTPNTGSG